MCIPAIWLAAMAVVVSQGERAVDARALFALFDEYDSKFHDVSFLYEGTIAQTARTAGRDPEPGRLARFQGLYAYRADGATLVDVFSFGEGGVAGGRAVYTLLHDRMEMLNASPDSAPPVRERTPLTGPGGPGSLSRPDSPERIFLAYYFATLGQPAEHELEVQGREVLDGTRCVRLRMLKQRKMLLKGWVGGFPYIKLWVDLERDGCPLRYELYSGDDLDVRAEISRVQRFAVPGGGHLWMPVAGRVSVFLAQSDRNALVHSKEPVYVESHVVLADTVKFDQGLADSFFSARKHATVTNEEGLRARARERGQGVEVEAKRPSADPESRQERLDEALAEADRQVRRLEASSAARASAGWLGVLASALWVAGIAAVGAAALWYWRTR